MSNTSSPTKATAHAGPPRPHETTLPQLVAAQATRTPRATALIRGEDRLTYGELDAWAQAIAGQLAQRGVRLEDRVGICAERSFEMVAGMLGILYAGAAYVPLGLDWPTARLSGALGDAEVRVVLVTANGEEHLRGNRGATTIPITPLRDDSIHGSRAYDADVAPEHLAYVIFTSGTTAQPKGVMISHRAICNRLLWMQTEYDTDASDVFIQKTPYTFDVSVWELLLPLICGAQVVLAEPDGHRDTRYLLELMRAHDVTTAHFVPSMLRRFLEDPELSSLTSLKRVICSGEALPYEVMQRFFARLDARLDNLYGPTEAAVDVSFWRCRPDYGSRAVPIGKAIDNIKLDVLDGNLRELPQGETGELCIAGVGLARGYINRPELTAEAFVSGPHTGGPEERIYRTGDMARVLPDGNLEYLGRRDRQVKIRGMRVEIDAVEAALTEHPEVGATAAMLRGDGPGGPELVAYVVLQSRDSVPAQADEAVLRGFVGDTLLPAAVPSKVVFLDRMPATSHGKLDYRALPEPSLTGTGRTDPPIGHHEIQLAARFCKILNIDEVGRNDDFWQLGGDSLRALELRNAIDLTLPGTVVYECPTVAALAERLREHETTSPDGSLERAAGAHLIVVKRSPRDQYREIVGAFAAVTRRPTSRRLLHWLQRWGQHLASRADRPVTHRQWFRFVPPYALLLADDPRGRGPCARAATLVLAALRLCKEGRDLVAEFGGASADSPPGNAHLWGSSVTPRAQRLWQPLAARRYRRAATHHPSHFDLSSHHRAETALVMARGHAYLLSLEGSPSAGEVAGRLAAIQRDAEGASDALPVGCLTHFSRAPLWGRTRAEFKRVQANAAALQRVQRTGLAVCLDTDAIPATVQERVTQMVGNSANRWHEKGIQLVITGDGRAGLICNHAILDGAPAMAYATDLQRTAQTLSLDETTRTATGRTQAIEWHATPRVATAAKVAASAPSPVVNCVELPGIGEEFWRSNRLPAPAAVLVVLAIAWTRALDGRVPLIVDTLDARHAVGGRVVFYQIMTDPIADAVRALAARSTDGRPWADCFRATTRLCAVRRQAAVAGTVGLNWCRPTGNVLGTLLGITGSLLSGSRRPQAVFTGIMPVTPGAPRWQGETMRYNYTFCQLLADRVCASTGGLEKVGELTRCAAEVLEQLPEVAT